MSPAGGSGSRQCAKTGLMVVPATSQTVWRIAKTVHGSLNPPLRHGGDDRSGWGRFDVDGGETAYFASTPECAYAEVLAYLRRRLGEADSLAKDAAAVGLSITEFAAAVEKDWKNAGHSPPGYVPRYWRDERGLYEMTLPAAGWWVDLATPGSIAAVETALGSVLSSLGVTSLDLAVLYGADRSVTTTIAEWVSTQTLDDASTPLGIVYDSKHATGQAWAYWLPVDTSPAVDEKREYSVEDDDPDLITVSKRFGITIL